MENEEYTVWKCINFFIQHKKCLEMQFTLKRFSKTFLVYDENGEENVHYFTTRHKHLSKREKKTLPVLTI